ncbi:16S rRNA (cytosine(1402)-N(4))-methyltransferase RsmH [Pseudooctadecabacter jejudonensis]|uniref:Ribosomal RNA small subunit methyltransferase H n=1 Tax=Pseudooctadecabacter jejudonensis TaxID=1391910 RepID=A0A1Y5RML5_9RHOB|nr:16S rRNA (cytosine(1402)-N(4))-methyltransferase RsmH [Pseudooctadecabacter jejudonensis]SLN20006.1 Ribosomal RNA small subunit methyltransferase H [Pseudooctadecabacter jejudonensis]
MGTAAATSPHIPVLIGPLVAACSPIGGTWIDGTFGAGGYTRELIKAGADQVIGIDRDPDVIKAATWVADDPSIMLIQDTFSNLDAVGGEGAQGVVLDLGVSSMQIDQAERGFSFMKDGPLDMRMGQEGQSAADIINHAGEADIADILFTYGEERASRRIARKIVAQRESAPIETTLQLAKLIEGCLPRPKPGQSHPATRSFQAIRIAVNDEYGQLVEGLEAAERVLAPGGYLAVVTFHSVEDRMVKRFFQQRAGATGNANRYAPALDTETPAFEIVTKKAIGPDADELAANTRARSAKLRVARRTEAPAGTADRRKLGMPQLKDTR